MGGMRIIDAFPPNYAEIAERFPVKGRPMLFAWGGTIYATNGAAVPGHKMRHEAIHGARQSCYLGEGSQGSHDRLVNWWRRYLDDPVFRLNEEVPAHVAEYLALCETGSGRAARRRALAEVSKQLASPLYGGLISCERARRVIIDAAEAAIKEAAPCL